MAIEKTINIDVNSKKAQKDVKNLEKSIEGVNKEVKDTTQSTQAMSGTLDKATGGAVSKFNGLKGTLKGVITSFKSLNIKRRIAFVIHFLITRTIRRIGKRR